MSKKARPQRRGNWKTPKAGWDEAEVVPSETEPVVKRTVEWKSRLVDYLAWSVGQKFVYGQFDCALFTFEAVKVMTGFDPGGPFRGQYENLYDGIALLREAGFRDHVDICARYFNEIPPFFAQAGDIAVVPGEDGPALGLVQGSFIYALLPTGMALVPLLSALRAFRVA